MQAKMRMHDGGKSGGAAGGKGAERSRAAGEGKDLKLRARGQEGAGHTRPGVRTPEGGRDLGLRARSADPGLVTRKRAQGRSLGEALTSVGRARQATVQKIQVEERVTTHTSRERARRTALKEAGALGHDRVASVGRLGAAKGRINGWQTKDGRRGFRIDYDPGKGIHYNWFDWTQGDRGSGGRWGAEIYPGSEADFKRALRSLEHPSSAGRP